MILCSADIKLLNKTVPVHIDGSVLYLPPLLFFIFLEVGVLTALLASLFLLIVILLSVFVHELGHAWAAIKAGMDVRKIEMNFLGGATYIIGNGNRTPLSASVVSIAGPLANAIIFGLAVIPLFFFSGKLLSIIALFNAILFLGNLIPLCPMDGSKFVHAISSYFYGEGTALKITYLAGIVSFFIFMASSVILESPILLVLSIMLLAYHIFSCNDKVFPAYDDGAKNT